MNLLCVCFSMSCVCFVRVFRVRVMYRACVFPMRFFSELVACASAFVVCVLCVFRVVCVCVSFLYIANTVSHELAVFVFFLNFVCVLCMVRVSFFRIFNTV